jgi:hypothetical protein
LANPFPGTIAASLKIQRLAGASATVAKLGLLRVSRLLYLRRRDNSIG